MKKIFSWILSLLALAFCAVAVVFLVLFFTGTNIWGGEAGDCAAESSNAFSSNSYSLLVAIFALVLSSLSGFFGHGIAEGKTFPFYVTYPFYFIILGIYYLVMACKFLFLKLLGSDASFDDVCLHLDGNFSSRNTEKGNASAVDTPVYYVTANGFRRALKLFDAHCQDYEAPDGANFGAWYSKYKDDLGNYWRSYDGNKTFISETSLREQGWKIPW